MTLLDQLQQGLTDLRLAFPSAVQDGLIKYIELLEKWNQVFNLTSVTSRDAMLTHHLLDSLSVVPYVTGPRILDIGSGAGLPGIPLALALPDLTFTLLDSNGKKTRFLTQVVAELALNNVQVVQARVETFSPPELFKNITARAFGSVRDIINQSRHLLTDDGEWLLLRGQFDKDEMPSDKMAYTVFPLQVPGLKKCRHLVKISKE